MNELPDALSEELEVLRSIYEEENGFECTCVPTDDGFVLKMSVSFGLEKSRIVLLVPAEYPMSPPRAIDEAKSGERVKSLIETSWTEGCECLYQLIEQMRENRSQDMDSGNEAHSLSDNADQDVNANADAEHAVGEEEDLVIHRGPIVEVNKSKFQAFVATVSCMEEVRAFHTAVVTSRACSRATHNIFAFRYYDGSVVVHDCDDDGESAAGSKLGEMLRTMDIVGTDRGVDGIPGQGVAVIVSRWYGGILLGPVRFKIICNTARAELESLGFLQERNRDRSTISKSRRGGRKGGGKR